MENGCEEGRVQERLKLELKPGTSRAVYLHIKPQNALEPKTYQLVHVVSRQGKEVHGGISYILINAKEG